MLRQFYERNFLREVFTSTVHVLSVYCGYKQGTISLIEGNTWWTRDVTFQYGKNFSMMRQKDEGKQQEKKEGKRQAG